jgi:hypothetical protein
MSPTSKSHAIPIAFALGIGGLPTAAFAQAAPVDVPGPTDAPPAPQREPSEVRDDEEIVVTAPTMPWGAARVPAQSTIDAAEIEAQAADTVLELLASLAPRTGGAQPVFLVNGERAEGGGGIASYPPEAIERIDILPPEAALAYGYPPGQMLLNIVLKPRFQSFLAKVDGGAATQGGGGAYTANAGRITIAGKSRWSVQLRGTRKDMLLESQRTIPNRNGAFGEGDARYRSIVPGTQALGLTVDHAGALGRFQSIVQFAADYNEGRRLLGLSLADVSAPALAPSNDGRAILRGRSSNGGASTAINVSGAAGAWLLNSTAQLAFSESRSRIDRGFGTLAPDGSGAAAAIGFGHNDSRTRTRNASAQIIASRPVAQLPGGAAQLNLQLGVAANSAITHTTDAPVFRSARRNASGRMALTVPVNSAIGGLLPEIGVFSINLSGGGTLANGEVPQTQFDYGFGWSPAHGINLNVSRGISSTPPLSDLLAAPLVETPNVRVYDFVTGERAEVVSVTGGNADLLVARTSTLDLRLALYPSFAKGLTLQTLFRRMVVRDAVGTFPALTSAVEEAFPARIFRDGEGHLLRVDTRPINIARSASETLSTNLAWQIGLGDGKLPASDEDSDKASAALPGQAFTGGRRTLSLGLNHIWTLRQDQLLRAGLPPLDRLAGEGGASPARHRVSAKAVVNLGGIGVDADLGWASPTVARNPGREGRPETKLDFSSKTQLDVRLFASPARLAGDAAGKAWAKGLRLSLDIDNLFDQRVSVLDQDGEVPAGFTRDEIDPFGRTIKFSVRKLF